MNGEAASEEEEFFAHILKGDFYDAKAVVQGMTIDERFKLIQTLGDCISIAAGADVS